MMRHLLLVLAVVAMTAMGSCGGNGASIGKDKAQQTSGDSTLCQFRDIKQSRMYSYTNEEGDIFYIDNQVTALWPELIDGKPCPDLQTALLRTLTDSAELTTREQVFDLLLQPNTYLEIAEGSLKTVDAIKTGDNNISASDTKIRLDDMGDRLITYHIASYGYMARAAHGIYANNYVTYDLKTGKVVTLNDIIADTTLLRNTIYKSIKQEYDYDKDNLFIPDNGLLPLPSDFYLKDLTLHVVYQVYEIASYAQGMIDAPIYPYMLKPEEQKQLFTPYGRDLLHYDDD